MSKTLIQNSDLFKAIIQKDEREVSILIQERWEVNSYATREYELSEWHTIIEEKKLLSQITAYDLLHRYGVAIVFDSSQLCGFLEIPLGLPPQKTQNPKYSAYLPYLGKANHSDSFITEYHPIIDSWNGKKFTEGVRIITGVNTMNFKKNRVKDDSKELLLKYEEAARTKIGMYLAKVTRLYLVGKIAGDNYIFYNYSTGRASFGTIKRSKKGNKIAVCDSLFPCDFETKILF